MPKEELIIPEIPKPQEDIGRQEPTRDVPTGNGHSLDDRLVASAHGPEDIQKALEGLPVEGEVVDEGEK